MSLREAIPPVPMSCSMPPPTTPPARKQLQLGQINRRIIGLTGECSCPLIGLTGEYNFWNPWKNHLTGQLHRHFISNIVGLTGV